MNEINIFKDDLKNDIDFINLYTEVTNELKEDDMNKILSPIIHTLKEDDPAISFIEEVNQIKLLSIEQEKELFQQVAKGKHAKEKVDLFNNKKIIINEAELDSLNELVDKGNEAEYALLEIKLKMVLCVAKRYFGEELNFIDLISEGITGLKKAIKMYKYTKKFLFQAFAVWFVRKNIIQEINYAKKEAHNLRGTFQIMRYIDILKPDLVKRLNRQPTNEELANELNITVEALRYAIKDHNRRERIISDDGNEL